MARCPECKTDWGHDLFWYRVGCKTCMKEWKKALALVGIDKPDADQLREWQPTARLIVYAHEPCPACHKSGNLLFFTIDEGAGAWCSACGFTSVRGDYSPMDGTCPACFCDRTMSQGSVFNCSACQEAYNASLRTQVDAEDAQQDAAVTRCPECSGELGTNTDYCTACQRHAGVYSADGW